MSIPKEPRALMIQLMYLVLTAMLALNITREVLNAFNTINSSIERSNTTIDQKNAAIYDLFDKAESNKEDADKVRPLNEKAKQIKKMSEDLVKYINDLKDTIIARSGGLIINERTGQQEPVKMEDIDVATVYFVEVDKKGDELKGKLESYINDLLQFLPEDERADFRNRIPINLENYAPTDENPTGDWSRGTFNNIPIIGAMTLLSKFQNDIKNAEGFVIEKLYSLIHLDDIHIDDYKVIAVPNVSYALAGDPIEATITLAAFSKSIQPQISHNAGGGKLEVKDGVGILKFNAANSPGLQTVKGNVVVPVKGENKPYPFEFKYMVGSTGASLGLDKMNVFYIGVDNPVTVSASGYNIEDVNLKFEDPDVTVTPTETKSKYKIKVTKPNPKGVPFVIQGKDKTGVVKDLEKGFIRVKRIPDPIAKVAGYKGGNIPINIAKSALGPIAELENFDFDVRFIITSFTFIYAPKQGSSALFQVNGTLFTNEVKDIMERSRPGDQWFITEIKAKGPDGTVRSLPSVALVLI